MSESKVSIYKDGWTYEPGPLLVRRPRRRRPPGLPSPPPHRPLSVCILFSCVSSVEIFRKLEVNIVSMELIWKLTQKFNEKHVDSIHSIHPFLYFIDLLCYPKSCCKHETNCSIDSSLSKSVFPSTKTKLIFMLFSQNSQATSMHQLHTRSAQIVQS